MKCACIKLFDVFSYCMYTVYTCIQSLVAKVYGTRSCVFFILNSAFGSDSASTVSYSSDELQQMTLSMEEAIKLNENVQDTMYFM